VYEGLRLNDELMALLDVTHTDEHEVDEAMLHNAISTRCDELKDDPAFQIGDVEC